MVHHIVVTILEVSLDPSTSAEATSTYCRTCLLRDHQPVRGTTHSTSERNPKKAEFNEAFDFEIEEAANTADRLLLEVRARKAGWFRAEECVGRCTISIHLLERNPEVNTWLPLIHPKHFRSSLGSIHVYITLKGKHHLVQRQNAKKATIETTKRDPALEYVFPNGSRYRGEWNGNALHGSGIFIGNTGERYEGEWRHNVRHGKGSLTTPSGSTYVGDFSNGEIHGNGTYSCDADWSYSGEWRQAKKHGHGVLSCADGQFYRGRWRGGKKEGLGECWSKGVYYYGYYCNNNKNGMGVMDVDGTYVEAEHANGKIVSIVEITQDQFSHIIRCLRTNTPYVSHIHNTMKNVPDELDRSISSDITTPVSIETWRGPPPPQANGPNEFPATSFGGESIPEQFIELRYAWLELSGISPKEGE